MENRKESGYAMALLLKKFPLQEPNTEGLGKKAFIALDQAEKKDGSPNNESGGGKHRRISTREMFEKLYTTEKMRPFHYSSSIYYGARDDYFQSEPTKQTEVQKVGNGGEDLEAALRGNWWQGSLYY